MAVEDRLACFDRVRPGDRHVLPEVVAALDEGELAGPFGRIEAGDPIVVDRDVLRADAEIMIDEAVDDRAVFLSDDHHAESRHVRSDPLLSADLRTMPRRRNGGRNRERRPRIIGGLRQKNQIGKICLDIVTLFG